MICVRVKRRDRASAGGAHDVIGADGRKRGHSFHRVLTRSAAKLHYAQVQAAIDGRADDETRAIVPAIIEPLYAAYRTIKKARDARGPLDLDLPERKILLKPDGTLDRVITPPRLDAHRLIEEFMILAMFLPPRRWSALDIPLIYRVHDEPARERVEALHDFLQTLDISSPKGGVLRPEQFNAILARREGARCAKVSSMRSSYARRRRPTTSPDNHGHFGLDLRRYAHFTSPIRRYADLIVHRALIRALKLGHGSLPDHQDEAALGEIAARISAAERRAMAAERETVDRLIAHFLVDRIGATFAGHISGVTRAGLFVKLDETGADGFVPARTIGKEYFQFHEREHAMIGRSSGETYQLGDAVTVRLVEAVPVAGALRFELTSEGRQGERRPRAGEDFSRAPRHQRRSRREDRLPRKRRG